MATVRVSPQIALVMYDERMYQGRSTRPGVVYAWAKRVERAFVRFAKEEAPVRTGELRNSIEGETHRTGLRSLDVVISVDAPHTMYVLGGTQGPIMSNRLWAFRTRTGLDLPRGGRDALGRPRLPFLIDNGYVLRLRPGNGFGQRYRLQVRGQEANEFMARAAGKVARRHSTLRGFTPTVAFWQRR